MAKTGLSDMSYGGTPGTTVQNPGGTMATKRQQPSTGYSEKMADGCNSPNKLRDLPHEHDKGPGVK